MKCSPLCNTGHYTCFATSVSLLCCWPCLLPFWREEWMSLWSMFLNVLVSHYVFSKAIVEIDQVLMIDLSHSRCRSHVKLSLRLQNSVKIPGTSMRAFLNRQTEVPLCVRIWALVYWVSGQSSTRTQCWGFMRVLSILTTWGCKMIK